VCPPQSVIPESAVGGFWNPQERNINTFLDAGSRSPQADSSGTTIMVERFQYL